jgi:hypothetical protein
LRQNNLERVSLQPAAPAAAIALGLTVEGLFMAELRTTKRERTYKVAMAWAGGHATTPCIVRNISPSGACLSSHSIEEIPDVFNLAFAGGRSRTCRVIWRKAKLIGVAFC